MPNKKLLEADHYKAAKAITCGCVGLSFGLFVGPYAAPTADAVCRGLSDLVADPIHNMIHGKCYEEINREHPKP